MKRRIKSGIISMVSVSLLLSLASCEREREYATPAKPVEVTAALNYYLTRGLLDGTINGVLYENGGVIALPAGTWRIRYVVSGHWWQLVVRGQGPTCHYIGTYNPIEAVMVHQGTHSSLLAEGLLEPVTVTVSEWQPLPGTEELWVFQDGVLASGITPLDRQDFCPKIEPPTAGPICGGVLVEGFCWYLSAVNADCQATCQVHGLAVDAAIDAGGNFWDAHAAAYCRQLLVQLQHPNIGLSTVDLTISSGYGLCGAGNTGLVIKRDGGPQDAIHPFTNGQVACPCQ